MEENLQDRTTVLLVDDERTILEVLTEMLKGLGYWVIAASNGPEAIKEYQTNRKKIGLIMLDIEMPGMKGYEVYTHLKNLEPPMNIPVLFSSGHCAADKINRILQRDRETAFMNKPFESQELALKFVLQAAVRQVAYCFPMFSQMTLLHGKFGNLIRQGVHFVTKSFQCFFSRIGRV